VPYSAKVLRPRGWIPPDQRRGSSAERGYGNAWRKIRRRILERDPICLICHLEPSNTVDHVIARAKGGSDDDSNLRAFAVRVTQEKQRRSMIDGCRGEKTAL
jgi:5-methylcytosine-specific restriction protein A